MAALPWLVACPPEHVDEGCSYRGRNYQLGEIFAAADGCNQCLCAAGGNVGCSERVCGDGGTDAGLLDGAAADRASDAGRVDSGGAHDSAFPDLPSRPNEVVPFPATACEILTVNGQAPAGPPAPGDAIVVSAANLPAPTAGAAVAQVQWSLVRAPPGSRTGLRSSAGFTTSLGRLALASTHLDSRQGPDLAGSYVLRAVLTDDRGGVATHSCHLEVRPHQALYLELSWDRQLDNVDLHLARRDSANRYCAVGVLPQLLTGLAEPCADAADVCYFGNCLPASADLPDWDGDGALRSAGDPVLWGDNSSGLGPEVISIDEPRAGSYLVSAQLWSGERLPATARVAVWVRGELWGYAEQSLELQQWWESFVVQWPATAGGQVCVDGLTAGNERCAVAPSCTPVGGCSACSSDGQCGPGTGCATSLGACVPIAQSCAADNSCAPGQLCVWSTDVCLDPACSPAAACAGAEEMCDEHSSLCVPEPVTCSENNEPNNTIATATAHATGFTDLLCRGDIDLVRVPGHAGAALHVYVALESDGSEAPRVQVALLDASGAQLDSQEVSRATLRAGLAVASPASADYYVRLDGSAAGARQYTYHVGVAECSPDPGEPNDTLDQAGNSVLVAGSYQRTLCGAADEDFYQILAPANLRTRAVVSYDRLIADIGIRLLSATGTETSSSQSGSGNETVRFTGGAAEQTVVLQVVRGWSSEAEVQSYAIELLHEPIPDCQDHFEPNEQLTSAALIGPGSFEANICDIDDKDYYAMDLSVGGSIDITVNFIHAEGDIDTRLLDERGKTLDSSSGTGNSETMQLVSVPQSGRYFVYVFPYSGTNPQLDRESYTLVVSGHGFTDAGVVDANLNDSAAPDTTVPDAASRDGGVED